MWQLLCWRKHSLPQDIRRKSPHMSKEDRQREPAAEWAAHNYKHVELSKLKTMRVMYHFALNLQFPLLLRTVRIRCTILITDKMFFHRLLYMKPHVFVHRNIIANWWRIESRVRRCPPEQTGCRSCCNERMYWNVQRCASVTRNKSGRSKSISNRYSTHPDTACHEQIAKLLWQDD